MTKLILYCFLQKTVNKHFNDLLYKYLKNYMNVVLVLFLNLNKLHLILNKNVIAYLFYTE